MLDLDFGLNELESVGQALLEDAAIRRGGLKPVVVALLGEMGAGKTTLFRAMGLGLNCDPLPTSPTYALMQEYRTPNGGLLLHADLYRLGHPEEWLTLDPDNAMQEADWVWLEWPENAGPWLPEHTLYYRLESLQDGAARRLYAVDTPNLLFT